MARHTITLGKNSILDTDSIEFIGIAERVTLNVGAVMDLFRLVGWNNKITMIKTLRGLVYVTQNQYGDTLPTETMSLKLAKDIVEWFIARSMENPSY